MLVVVALPAGMVEQWVVWCVSGELLRCYSHCLARTVVPAAAAVVPCSVFRAGMATAVLVHAETVAVDCDCRSSLAFASGLAAAAVVAVAVYSFPENGPVVRHSAVARSFAVAALGSKQVAVHRREAVSSVAEERHHHSIVAGVLLVGVAVVVAYA